MKNVRDYDLNNKKVIIRVDFNVPIKDGIILDDNRIKESLATIKYCLHNNAKVILLSHLGRIETEKDKLDNTLNPIGIKLGELLNKEIKFIPCTRGIEVENAVNNMNIGDVLLLENTRYEDLVSKKESKNNPELGKYWASLGDIFINDAFGTSHRSHASNVGIASNIPSGIGFLIEKELDNLLPVINKPRHPFVIIMGGSKIKDKIGLINNLIDKCDYILIGGGMAYTFLKSQNIEVGKSIVDKESITYCQNLLNKTNKIILPIDHVCTKSIESNKSYVCDNISFDDIGLDIGPKTINLFKSYIRKSETIVWNGPLGLYENDLYKNGTKEIMDCIANHECNSIICGGDTGSAAINMGYKNKFSHISTGGGASLELLEGKDLPGINIIK